MIRLVFHVVAQPDDVRTVLSREVPLTLGEVPLWDLLVRRGITAVRLHARETHFEVFTEHISTENLTDPYLVRGHLTGDASGTRVELRAGPERGLKEVRGLLPVVAAFALVAFATQTALIAIVGIPVILLGLLRHRDLQRGSDPVMDFLIQRVESALAAFEMRKGAA